MTNITILGIDLAKNIFELCGLDQAGNTVYRRTVKRAVLQKTVAKLSVKEVAMEACGSAHYWSRVFSGLGLQVKMMSPVHVKAFVKGQKNDRNDAQAIAIAASQKSMTFVAPKSEAQQDIQSLLRMRERLIHNRTQLINEVRGLLLEYGITINRGPSRFKKELVVILAEESARLTEIMRRAINRMLTEYLNLGEEIKCYDAELMALYKQSTDAQRVATIPGVGLLSALATVASIGDIGYFKSARHLSAYLGLVPKQHSSGGTERLLGITKRGNTMLRTLLIHGARSLLQRVDKHGDRRSEWIKRLRERVGFNKACVALANKQARTIWALLTRQEDYQVDYSPHWGEPCAA